MKVHRKSPKKCVCVCVCVEVDLVCSSPIWIGAYAHIYMIEYVYILIMHRVHAHECVGACACEKNSWSSVPQKNILGNTEVI